MLEKRLGVADTLDTGSRPERVHDHGGDHREKCQREVIKQMQETRSLRDRAAPDGSTGVDDCDRHRLRHGEPFSPTLIVGHFGVPPKGERAQRTEAPALTSAERASQVSHLRRFFATDREIRISLSVARRRMPISKSPWRAQPYGGVWRAGRLQ